MNNYYKDIEQMVYISLAGDEKTIRDMMERIVSDIRFTKEGVNISIDRTHYEEVESMIDLSIILLEDLKKTIKRRYE